jgi:hypothetical protein
MGKRARRQWIDDGNNRVRDGRFQGWWGWWIGGFRTAEGWRGGGAGSVVESVVLIDGQKGRVRK